MDLFEDNDCLYQPATKGNSNRQEKDRIFLRISRQFEGATCKYCIIAQARVMLKARERVTGYDFCLHRLCKHRLFKLHVVAKEPDRPI